MKHSSLIVLDALLNGMIVELDGRRYGLDEKNRLLAMLEDNESGMVVDCSLPAFISWCEKVSEQEIFLIAANNALTQCKERKAR